MDKKQFYTYMDSQEEQERLKEAMATEKKFYELYPRYDSRQSFYKKAFVSELENGAEILYSYGTPVVVIKGDEVNLLAHWGASQTTLRHVKEFLKQNGFTATSYTQIASDYPYVDRLSDSFLIDMSPEKRESLNEGAPNFGKTDGFPLYVGVDYSEVIATLEDVYYNQSNTPLEADFDQDDFDEFIDNSLAKMDIAVLDDDTISELEYSLGEINSDIKEKAEDVIDELENKEGSLTKEEDEKLEDAYVLKDTEVSLKSGRYSGFYIGVSSSFKYLSKENKEFIIFKVKEIAKKFGLTEVEVAYSFSNGETGYNIVENKIDKFESEQKFSRIEQAVFENALDCLYYGAGFKALNYYDISEDRAKEIWKLAKEFYGNYDNYTEEKKVKPTEEKKETLDEELRLIADLSDYTPWSGARHTWNKLEEAGVLDRLEDCVIDLMGTDELTMTQLNDFLWFEWEAIEEYFGLKDEEEDEPDLPEEVETTLAEIGAEEGTEYSDDEINELINEYLSSEYDYLVFDYNYTIEGDKISITDIEWDIDEGMDTSNKGTKLDKKSTYKSDLETKREPAVAEGMKDSLDRALKLLSSKDKEE